MGRLAPWSPITPTTHRDTIAARIARVNDDAKAERRRSPRGERYEVTHFTLNLLLYQWQMAEQR